MGETIHRITGHLAILAAAFMFVLAAGLAVSPAAHAETITGSIGSDIAYSLDAGTGHMEVTGTGEMPDGTLDADVRERVTSLVIQPGVTSVGEDAFQECPALVSVDIPESVTRIGGSAFRGCGSLKCAVVRGEVDMLDRFGSYSFQGMAAGSLLYVPTWDMCESLGRGNSNIYVTLDNTTVVVGAPEGTTVRGYCGHPAGSNVLATWTLDRETGLLQIEGPGDLDGAPWADADELRPLVREVSALGNVAMSTGGAFKNCTNLEKADIREIGDFSNDYVFQGCTSLVQVELPASATEIGKGTFEDCTALEAVTIPDSVQSIDEGAFRNCTALTTVTLDEGLSWIGYQAFMGCSALQAVSFPDSLAQIFGDAFRDCSFIQTVVLPASVETVGSGAFYGLHSPSIIHVAESSQLGMLEGSYNQFHTLPKAGCDPADDTFFTWEYDEDSHVLRIGGKGNLWVCPWGTSGIIQDVQKLEVSGNIVEIDDEAFTGGNMDSVEISAPVARIGADAFKDCGKLKRLDLPAQLETIGSNAFVFCNALEEISVASGGTFEAPDTRALVDARNHELVLYANGSGADYAIPGTVKRIGDEAFYCCDKLEKLEIPASVESIGSRAFQECTGLASIVLLTCTKNIGENAFWHLADSVLRVETDNWDYYQWLASEGIFGSALEYTGEEVEPTPDPEPGPDPDPDPMEPDALTPGVVALEFDEYDYTGKACKPRVTVYDHDAEVVPASEYRVAYRNNVDAGKGSVVVTAVKGSKRITGSATVSFDIFKAAQETAKVKTSSKTVKGCKKGKLAKAASFSIAKQGVKGGAKCTFALKSVPKAAKKHVKLTPAGKVTVKKGLKKGTYKLKVTMKVAKTKNYKAATVAKTITLKVK